MRSKNLLIGGLLLVLVPLAGWAGEKRIKASAAPVQTKIQRGEVIDVPVALDLGALPEKLGSYTAELSWNPAVLEFLGFSGGSTPGFEKPVVNAENTTAGKLRFAHANPYGMEGKVNVLNVRFKVTGTQGAVSELDLSFSAMAAAGTFTDLMPFLDGNSVQEQVFQVGELPEDYALEQNFPNPFNAGTAIKFSLPENRHVELAVYDLLGRQVRILLDEPRDSGEHVVNWDGRDEQGAAVTSGVYVVRMHAGDFVAQRKIVLVK